LRNFRPRAADAAGTGMERRLAAILAADVVGYSRLMEADEAGTFARLRAHRKELVEPAIAAHRGRVFKLMGDGLLAEFASVVDAVECAVALQRGMAERNAAAPADHRIEFRIGVNLGDVIVEKDEAGTTDIHGDGVNLAARLQQLAEPGGVCVSQTVVNHVGNKVAVGFDYVGEQRVKNIAQPVRVYRVLTDGAAPVRKTPWRKWRWPAAAAALALVLAAGIVAWLRPWEQPTFEAAAVERMALPLPDKPSIVVLPFANMSGSADDEYFADGMTEDLTTDLSRLSGLFVISRNTAFTYKGKAVKPAQVAEELGVRYILEGSVRRGGEEVRINAQLIDALSGGHVWADRYDGSLADVFALQDKVTNAIVDALALRLANAEQLIAAQSDTSVPAAHDAYLRGLEHYRRTTADDYAKAIPYLEEAVRLDADYGRAYGTLAMLYLRTYTRGYAPRLGLSRPQALDKAKQYMLEAQKHPTSVSHQAAGYIKVVDNRHKAAIAEFQEAITLDPGDSWSYVFMGWALSCAGRAAEAIPHIRTGMRLDPHYPPTFLWFLGHAQFGAEDYEAAAESLEGVAKLSPDDDAALELLVATYGLLGRPEEAKDALARANGVRIKRGGLPLTVFDSGDFRFARSSDRNRVKKGYRLAGVPETLADGEFANRLTPDEIRSLVFGHRLRGRDPDTGTEHAASFTADGAVTASGNWAWSNGGVAVIIGEQLCFKWSDHIGADCVTIFRNPGGTRQNENEFIWYDRNGARPFSPLE
jgi:TolB-like protein/class 3 adenylate cyclase